MTQRQKRSTSAPPGYTESVTKKLAAGGNAGGSGNAAAGGGGMSDTNPPWERGTSPQGSDNRDKLGSTTDSRTWTPVRYSVPGPAPKDLHPETADGDPDDFVSGGIELPPDPGKDCGERLLPGNGNKPPIPTRPLPSLLDPQLADFWPPGEGTRALFLDYDGTLREFEARPELATPTSEIMELLQAINARQDFAPHIISGRDARFLEASFASLSRFTLIAEHGFQIWRAGSEGWEIWDHPDGLDKEHEDWKAVVREHLTGFVHATPGSHVEEKQSSLVWHYREVADAASAEAAALEYMERLEEIREKQHMDKIRISHGHKVVEVSYRKVRKGPVMRRICEEKAVRGTPFLSVFVAGDDTSDESMFDIAPHDFLTVKIGPAITHAKFRLGSPAQLRSFLWQLIS